MIFTFTLNVDNTIANNLDEISAVCTYSSLKLGKIKSIDLTVLHLQLE